MMMRVKAPAVIILLSCAAVFCLIISIPLKRRDTSSSILVERVVQLEAQNKRLHQDIGILAKHLLQEERATMPEETSSKEDKGYSEDSIHSELGCETLHVVMVAAGIKTARSVVTVVKSILFYRHNPLHFHFLTDKMGRHILSTIFRTWQLPAINVSFYSTEKIMAQVSWVPNSHYSGVFGLMKLTLTSVLPTTLQQAIVLDTDLMLTDDIGSLWRLFSVIKRRGKLLGLVENQSDWYLGNLWEKHHPWPAIGRGFNTGVILLNLKEMREKSWIKMWVNVAKTALQRYRNTALADQDIINAVIKENPDIHYVLPCTWNIQMSEHTLSDYCFSSGDRYRIIHWNSPLKLQVQQNHGPYFTNMYKMFEAYNGQLLQSGSLRCDEGYITTTLTATNSEGKEHDPCSDFRAEGKKIYRTHPFILDYHHHSEDPTDITLVAQLSMDRLQILEALCKQWEGPLSITLYASDSDVQELLDYFSRSSFFSGYTKLALHVVFKSGHFYPVNYLRNVAMENSQTPFVFLSDIDFLPMKGLYHYLRETIRVLGMENKRALVVPAFETLLYKFTFPENKVELLRMLERGDVYTFRYHVWKEGHAPTNYDHWKMAAVPYKVSWAPNFEPYVVVSRNVSRYDERFLGFGWNKVSHIMELDAQGYEFVVLHTAFMVHMPHAPSLDIAEFRTSKHYRDCVQVLKREFQRGLVSRYGYRVAKYQ